MKSRKSFIQTAILGALIALGLPALAAAQGNYDPYGRPDYRRNRDENYGRYGRYDYRQVRESARRLENASDRLQRDLDRALDHSRVDGTRREDNINRMARDFHRAASDLQDRVGDARDLYRSEGEARRVFDLASQIGRIIRRNALYDNRVASDWAQVQRELSFLSDVYGYRMSGYGNDGYYRRDDDYRNGRDYPRNSNDPWWRRIPQ